MIGVIANGADQEVAREFFELFKTPWEFYRPGQPYEVVLCAAEVPIEVAAKLVLVYSGRKTRFDDEQNIFIGHQICEFRILAYKDTQLPIYGSTVSFHREGTALLAHHESGECAAFFGQVGGSAFVRIGYDLFAEIRALLTTGQPPAQAHIPTLELHIALLRLWILGCGIPVEEIPPVPEGYRFIACLTHDVDHPFLRKHKWDHTSIGFLFRTVVLWFWDLIGGRTTLQNVVTNWVATLKLPFIHLGLAKDFWSDFDERYAAAEQGLPSTFFVIPFEGRKGIGIEGAAPKRRAAGYGARDVAGIIRRLRNTGHEVCLHGIDAWCDPEKAREEIEEILRLTGTAEIGVRMHWLYQNGQTASVLDQAGADYDSTAGYGVTVGYRAGSTQAFKPFGADRLLELPMHAMDTALFYLSYLGLNHREAMERLAPMFESATRFGGCMTINWHDRSLAPERLWGRSYGEILAELRKRDPWFATAGDAVAWFRKRRGARFVTAAGEPGKAQVARPGADCARELPGLRLRTYQPRTIGEFEWPSVEDYIDQPLEEVGAGVPALRER